MATVFPLLVGMANILLYGAAFTLALAVVLVWSLHRSASQAQQVRVQASFQQHVRPTPIRPAAMQTWSGRN